jgi:hypothetical protein
MFTAILGFLAPFIPDLLGMGKGHLDHKHEMDMLKLRGDQSMNEAHWRMEEVEIRANQADISEARKPAQSFGVQLLDKASETDGVIWKWSMNCVFIAFSILDWLISFVRPGVAFFIFGLYGAIKIAVLYEVFDITGSLATTLRNESAWTQFDQDILLTILFFYFGDRIRKRAKQEQS